MEYIDTRSGFGDGLLELGRKNPDILALCADLTGSLKMDKFKSEFPDRFFQVGIAEANMMGIAAGMTIGGKIPFTGTFANFSTSTAIDNALLLSTAACLVVIAFLVPLPSLAINRKFPVFIITEKSLLSF